MSNDKIQEANSKPSLFIIGLGKSEALNTKQTQITKIQNPKHIPRYFFPLQRKGLKWGYFENLNFGFRNCSPREIGVI